MKKFINLCESLSVIKKTTVMRYPKQIQISKEFVESLGKELERFFGLLKESKQPVNNFTEKFLKALRFHVVDLTEKKHIKKPGISQLELIQGVRKPLIKAGTVETPKKGGGYDRNKEKKQIKKDLED